MHPPELAAFKYGHADPAQMSPDRLKWLRRTLVACAIFTLFSFPFGAVVFLVPLVIRLSAPRLLFVGPRYLICGRKVVYFANVTRLRLDAERGKLRIESAVGAPLEIDRDKFPTGARKADKIAKNKAAKFDKLAAKISDKVRAASPEAELRGFPS